MWAKYAAVAGTAIGWGTAGALIFLNPDPRFILIQAFALSVGIVSVVCLVIMRRNRPMGAIFELAFELGERSMLKKMNCGERVVVQMPVRDERHAAHG